MKTTNDWYHIFSSYKESVFSWIIKLSVLLSPLFVLSCTCCNSLTETIFQVCSTTAYIRSSSTSTRQVWIVACLQNPMIRLSIGSTSFLPLLHYFFPLNLWRIAFGINCPNRKRLGIDLRETIFTAWSSVWFKCTYLWHPLHTWLCIYCVHSWVPSHSD